MLWTVIRDFFVQFVFGGNTSTGEQFGGLVGQTWAWNAEEEAVYDAETYLAGFCLPIPGFDPGNEFAFQYLSLGDWLSTTATIITLCLLLFAVFLGIKFLFKLVAGSFLKIGE